MSRLSELTAAILALTICTNAAGQAGPPQQVLDALVSGDCVKVGALVNQGLEARFASMALIAGVLYEEGLCVKQSVDRANRFYRDAQLSRADAQTMMQIGVRYAFGIGVPQSFTRAGVWFLYGETVLRGSADSTRIDLAAEEPQASPQTEWKGYLAAVHVYAALLVDFPRRAAEAGIEGTVTVEVCTNTVPPSVGVDLQSFAVQRPNNSHSGPRNLVRDFETEVRSAYAKAIETLPVPRRSENFEPTCGQRQLAFVLR